MAGGLWWILFGSSTRVIDAGDRRASHLRRGGGDAQRGRGGVENGGRVLVTISATLAQVSERLFAERLFAKRLFVERLFVERLFAPLPLAY